MDELSKSKKVDLSCFYETDMNDKLLIALLQCKEVDRESKENIIAYSTKFCDDNFVYPDGKRDIVIMSLAVYLLGMNDGYFSAFMEGERHYINRGK